MKRATLKTLTPVHIGNEGELKSNIEFLYDGKRIAVVDEEKVLDIIGGENVDQWVSIIENKESLLAYLEQCKEGFTIDQVARRIIDLVDEDQDLSRHLTLKEQIHNGKGEPMIPGSSVKGAIRTALLTRMIIQEQENIRSSDLKDRDGKWSSKRIERKLLGDTRSDPLRFFRISDAHFAPETLALNMEILNFQSNGWGFKRGGNQLTEMIWGEDEAPVKIGFHSELVNANEKKGFIEKYYSWLDHLPVLFDEVNKHTAWLIDKELSFWEDQKHDLAAVDHYLSFLEDIQSQLKEIDANREMILRLGHGSGWHFITGGWIKYLENILDEREYRQLSDMVGKRGADIFPKTRKLESIGELLGFIKISV